MARGFLILRENTLISRVSRHRPGPFGWSLLLAGIMLMLAVGEAGATISVSAQFEPRLLPSLEIDLFCGRDHPDNRSITLSGPGHKVLLEGARESSKAGCRVRADLPPGYSVTYHAVGHTDSTVSGNGCLFPPSVSGEQNDCQLGVTQNPVMLMVYKKWIGGSGEEKDVRVSLDCESGDYSGYRYINEGSPDGWEIRDIHPDGILCNVSEQVRDNFEADIIDCQGLFVLPGKGEECTLLNTKIVKRIEMLNRYGKFIMIFLILVAGLLAMKRFS